MNTLFRGMKSYVLCVKGENLWRACVYRVGGLTDRKSTLVVFITL